MKLGHMNMFKIEGRSWIDFADHLIRQVYGNDTWAEKCAEKYRNPFSRTLKKHDIVLVKGREVFTYIDALRILHQSGELKFDPMGVNFL